MPDYSPDTFEDWDYFRVVIIEKSDSASPQNVEAACISLFNFTQSDARILAVQVNTEDQAPVVVLREPLAYKALEDLAARNILARMG
jgi:hypothetical protein